MCFLNTGCEECIGSRDPHCVWHDNHCQNIKNVSKKYAFQDVLKRRIKLCSTMAAAAAKDDSNKSILLLGKSQEFQTGKLVSIDPQAFAENNNTIDNNKRCVCIPKKNCNCSKITENDSIVPQQSDDVLLMFSKRLFGIGSMHSNELGRMLKFKYKLK